jgi:dienelactone hydrolase
VQGYGRVAAIGIGVVVGGVAGGAIVVSRHQGPATGTATATATTAMSTTTPTTTPTTTSTLAAPPSVSSGQSVKSPQPVDSPPAAAIAPAVACDARVEDVYATPPDLPPWSTAARGVVVRCARDTDIDATAIDARLSTAGVAATSTSGGAHTYRIAFRTTRFDGSAGLSSARVFLPVRPRTERLPVIVAAHATAGLADACAPSKWETADDYLVLPWLAHGYAVIAPDYAGLGTEGTQGYGDNLDTGYSVLDSARALRKLLPSASLSSAVVVVGHSQGGGAALSAQALARTYGSDGDLAGVVAFAPGWQTGVNVNVDAFRYQASPTSMAGGTTATIAALYLDSYFANRRGPAHAGDGFGKRARAALTAAVDSECLVQLAGAIPSVAPKFGDLFDETLASTSAACVDGKTCVEPGRSYVAFLRGNVLASDPAAGRVLVVLGGADTAITPAASACLVAKMQREGVNPQVCVDPAAQHLDVAPRNAAFGVAWTDALVDGTVVPPCAASPPSAAGACP